MAKILLALLFITGCGGGCNFEKMKDKAMEYKDKVPADKLPLPKVR
jgi:hypothetical protein